MEAIDTLAVATAFYFVPIVWLVLQASNAVVRPWSFGSFGQIAQSWDRIFASNWIGGDTLQWLANLTLYSAAGAAIAVALCVSAGYGLAITDFVGRRLLLILTMVVMLIPTNALVLPLFLEANAAHLLSSPLAVILPFGLFPFGVFVAYLYFDTAVVHDLLAAARIDGCDELQAFRRVALPLAAPVVAMIAVLDFVAGWTNYFLPWVMYGHAASTTGRHSRRTRHRCAAHSRPELRELPREPPADDNDPAGRDRTADPRDEHSGARRLRARATLDRRRSAQGRVRVTRRKSLGT